MGGIQNISPVLSPLCTKGFQKIMGEMTHFKEYWADGEEHYEEVTISCQKLENGPVGYENPWKYPPQKSTSRCFFDWNKSLNITISLFHP